ncbi:hypothetical protein [Cryptosporangium sp. NPDC051539]|uniref:hypothetical protein n=1 Tax=Cryptosporangium sp. NPDC051539 TaxID=3363962 RepID=UPI0037B6CF43
MPDQLPVRSVRSGAVGYLEVPTAEETHIAALLEERRGYVARGLDDRVAQVDAELQRLVPEPLQHEEPPAGDGEPPTGDEEPPASETEPAAVDAEPAAVDDTAVPPRATTRRTRRR